MSHDVIFQGQLFGAALVWGGGLMFAYDCIRLLRLFVTHRRAVQAVEEILFWIVASMVIYGLIYRYNSGAVRNYVVFGMAAGMIFYRICLSPWFIKAACFILRPVQKLFRTLKTFLKDLEKGLKSRLTGVTIRFRESKFRKNKKQGD